MVTRSRCFRRRSHELGGAMSAPRAGRAGFRHCRGRRGDPRERDACLAAACCRSGCTSCSSPPDGWMPRADGRRRLATAGGPSRSAAADALGSWRKLVRDLPGHLCATTTGSGATSGIPPRARRRWSRRATAGHWPAGAGPGEASLHRCGMEGAERSFTPVSARQARLGRGGAGADRRPAGTAAKISHAELIAGMMFIDRAGVGRGRTGGSSHRSRESMSLRGPDGGDGGHGGASTCAAMNLGRCSIIAIATRGRRSAASTARERP
jgi:hypothetical protein